MVRGSWFLSVYRTNNSIIKELSRSLDRVVSHQGGTPVILWAQILLYKKDFVFIFFCYNTYSITLINRSSPFYWLRSLSVCIKIYQEKDNNILHTKACGRHVFFYVIYQEITRQTLWFHALNVIYFPLGYLYTQTDCSQHWQTSSSKGLNYSWHILTVNI